MTPWGTMSREEACHPEDGNGECAYCGASSAPTNKETDLTESFTAAVIPIIAKALYTTERQASEKPYLEFGALRGADREIWIKRATIAIEAVYDCYRHLRSVELRRVVQDKEGT